MKVVLISTYELGQQPFGLASPAAWLRARGADVACLDLSREALAEEAVREADIVAFYVPMHTATRLAVALLPRIREMNPRAHLCFYGLYAPVNETYLRGLGVRDNSRRGIRGRAGVTCKRLANERGADASKSACGRSRCGRADRAGDFAGAAEISGAGPQRTGAARKICAADDAGRRTRTVGYTEASRGCKHLCRHCPIVPVYNGVFRVVDRDVVLADIRQQVEAGAQHITFGDPDFFNGTGHAMPIVEALHREFPRLTYDVTIKIEHLLKHRDCLPKLRDTGCLFVTSAVESVDDAVLEKLEKHHTRADFLAAVELFREIGLTLQPTFVPFTPWTTLEGYRDLLALLRKNDLIGNVAPIQLAIRLLIPAGSRLLELEDVRELVGPFDEAALVYRWKTRGSRAWTLVRAHCRKL